MERVKSAFSDLNSTLDQLDWTATGKDRWLASAIIGALGVLSLSIQLDFVRQSTLPSEIAYLIPAIPIGLSVLIIGSAGWIPLSEYGLYAPRLALWCVIGGVVLVAVGQLAILAQRLLATSVGAPLILLSYSLTTGIAIGLVVGLYDARSEQTKVELDKQRDRAERYAQQISVLNRVLRHDLRTGVEVISSYVEVLPDPPDEEPINLLNRIEQKAEDLQETAETARELELLMGTREEMMTDVDLDDTLRSAADTVSSDHPEATLHVEDLSSTTIQASRILELALEELLTNAVEHNNNESVEVWLSCEDMGENVYVRITDNGPGIPETEVQPLHEGEETALVHGSGIGLWLAHWIINSSSGSMSFEENEFGGTTVTVQFPR